MAMRALENGAFLFIKKPATLEILRCLWQYVLKDKTRMLREKERFPEAAATGNYSTRGMEIFNGEDYNGHNYNDSDMMNNKGKLGKKKLLGHKGSWRQDDYSQNHMFENNKVRRKVCTEWTQELHAKFMDAVRQLGEGRCFPKEILDLMNTPGLTRMQVASHLQKCRNDNWRAPDERKSQQNSPQASSHIMSNYKPRRFGSMPLLAKEQSEPRSGSETETVDKGENGKMGLPPAAYEHPPQPGQARGGRRHPSDEFFRFTDMDCLIQNFPGVPQGSVINPQASGAGPCHLDQVYIQQNSVVPRMDGSQWSSEATNFESDGSDTKDNENN
ncbi:uncharacterized protein [Primulina eburnea]|uniref:uncharacterized protein n=1 Tax=Primulina eburnea TaxID=1245227 RepID=UPI003C6BDE6B